MARPKKTDVKKLAEDTKKKIDDVVGKADIPKSMKKEKKPTQGKCPKCGRLRTLKKCPAGDGPHCHFCRDLKCQSFEDQ